jgi:phosphohistidine swiveling domain-containing protein
MAATYGVTRFEFNREEDLKNYTVWVLDRLHAGTLPQYPLPVWFFLDGFGYGMQHGAETICIPETKGMDVRLIDGYFYVAAIECKPEEVEERDKVFRERVSPYIENIKEKWDREMAEWEATLNEFKQFDRENASDIELWDHFEDLLYRFHPTWWKLHMDWYYAIFGLYTLFIELCQELLVMDVEHPTFKKLLSGFDNKLFGVNRGLWRLGETATQLKLNELFLGTEDNKGLLLALGESEAGNKWLERFHEFLKVHGWRGIDAFDSSSRTWLMEPHVALSDVKQAIGAIERGERFRLDEERKVLTKERQEAESEVLAKVSVGQREWFEKLLRVAQQTHVISEEHTYYLDLPCMAVERTVFDEFGKRFAREGVIDEVDDVLYLLPDEIRKAAVCMGRINLRTYVDARKKEREANCKIEPEPFIGDITKFPDLVMKNPILRFISEPPKVKPELKADLYGCTSTAGVVEGVARVIMRTDEVAQIQPGEILVAITTNATYTPAFGIVSGVVTDVGSTLCHAVIVAREYGLPAVVGTGEATAKIKTGDRIRIDADTGTVYILKK